MARRSIDQRAGAPALDDAMYRSLLDSAPDAIIVVDEAGRIVFANAQAERVFGWTRDELLALRIEDLMPTRFRERHVTHRERFSDQPRTRPMGEGRELFGMRRDGTEFPVEISLSPLRTSSGTLVSAAVRDVSERRQTEEALRELEEKFRGAFEFASIGMAIVSLSGEWVRVNAAMSSIVGYSEAELRKLTFQEITHPDDLETDLEHVSRLLSGEIQSYSLEKRYIHRDGHAVWILLNGSMVRSADGAPLYFVAQIQNISARKEAETRLRRSEALLAEAQRLAHLGSWEWNVLTDEVTLSNELYNLYGMQPEEGPRAAEILVERVHLEDRPRAVAIIRGAAETHEAFAFDYRVVLPDGSTKWLHARGEVETDAAGKTIRVHGTSQDLTERRAIEDRIRASLREKEALLREVHHRVKNNLQVISSLLSLQSDQAADASVRELLKDSRNRIRSMALVHESLYRSTDIALVELSEYLGNLGKEILNSHGRAAHRIKLRYDMVPIRAEVDVAVNCGLILNELLSNSFKHAFPGSRTGEVKVVLRRAPPHGIFLEIRDDGQGAPPSLDLERSPTLGLHLVAVLARQLDGELTYDRENGFGVQVRFPQGSAGPAAGRGTGESP